MKKLCSLFLSLALILTSLSLGSVAVTALEVFDLTPYVTETLIETPYEFADGQGGRVGICYYIEYDAREVIESVFSYSVKGDDLYQTADAGYMAVVIDGAEYTVEQYANSGGWYRLNIDHAGLLAGVAYEIGLRVYGEDGDLAAEQQPQRIVSGITSVGAVDNRTPLNVDVDTSEMNELSIDYIWAKGISTWSDGSANNLIDGNVGVPTTSPEDRPAAESGTKLGGGEISESFIVEFESEQDLYIDYYTLYTGGDTANWPERNPIGWILYGTNDYSMDYEDWDVLDTVMTDTQYYTGMEAASAMPYTYQVDHPDVYACYAFRFYTSRDVFQMNELKVYGSAMEQVDFYEVRLDEVSRFTTGNGVGIVYDGGMYYNESNAAYTALMGGSLGARVTIQGGIYQEATTFAVENYYAEYLNGEYIFYFDAEGAGIEIGLGYEYEITTTLVDQAGRAHYVFTDGWDSAVATVNTVGASPRPSDCLTGDAVDALLKEYTDLSDHYIYGSAQVDQYTWAGEGVGNLFDGDYTTKMAGNGSWIVVDWCYDVPVKLDGYVLVSGNDVAAFPGRNPVTWWLWGSNDGENWVELDYVDRPLFAAENGVPYGRRLSDLSEYRYYSLEFITDGQFELGEVILLGKVGENTVDPDAVQTVTSNELKLEYVSEFLQGNGLGIVYHPTPADLAAWGAWNGMADGTLTPRITIQGGIYEEPTSFVIEDCHHDLYDDGYAFRFNAEAAGIKIGNGYTYEIKTELLDDTGKVKYIFTDGYDMVEAQISTAGTPGRPSQCLTGNDALDLLDSREDYAELLNPNEIYTNNWTWSGEGADKLFDGDSFTKMAGQYSDCYVRWEYTAPVTVEAYALYSGNDVVTFPARNPVSWYLLGSNDGVSYYLIDYVEWAGFEAANEVLYGRIVENPVAYQYYRMEFFTNGQFELGEIILLGEEKQETPNPGPDPTEKLNGDVNEDGVINMRDVAMIAQYISGLDVELDPEIADVTGEGYVNTKDILLLRQYLCGLDVELK